jgi:hypothetical protein
MGRVAIAVIMTAAMPMPLRGEAGNIRKISASVARRARDEFYPKDNLRPDRLFGIDQAVNDAVSLRFLNAPLEKGQLNQLFQYQLPFVH